MKKIQDHLHTFSRNGIIALLGITIWHMATKDQTITTTLTFSLYLYNVKTEKTYDIPENITLTVSGTRQQIQQLAVQQHAIHIDAHTLSDRKNHIALHQLDIFLPESINVVDYRPIPVTVAWQENVTLSERI